MLKALLNAFCVTSVFFTTTASVLYVSPHGLCCTASSRRRQGAVDQHVHGPAVAGVAGLLLTSLSVQVVRAKRNKPAPPARVRLRNVTVQGKRRHFGHVGLPSDRPFQSKRDSAGSMWQLASRRIGHWRGTSVIGVSDCIRSAITRFCTSPTRSPANDLRAWSAACDGRGRAHGDAVSAAYRPLPSAKPGPTCR